MDRRSILIFRNGSIGNTLMAVPAIKSIRNSFPEARIHIVVDRIGFDLLEHCPYIDTLITYDKRDTDQGFSGFLTPVRKLRALRPDCAVLFKRFFRNGLMAYLSGAETRAGFRTNGKAPFLNLTLPYESHIHITDLNLKLAALIGATSGSAGDPEIFLDGEDLNHAARLCKLYKLDERQYIVVHYGGTTSGGSHVAPQLLADLLARLRDEKPILFVGAGDTESAAAETLVRVIPNSHSVTNLPLRTSIALTKTCYGFVGMNSGPTHIAAACGVPGLALYRDDENFAAESVKWAPRSNFIRVIPVAFHLSAAQSDAVLAKAQQAWREVTTQWSAS